MSTAILEGYGDLIIHDGNTDFTIVKPTPFSTNSIKVKRWWRQNYNVVTYEACAIVELLDFYIVVSCAQDVQLKMTFDGTSAVTFDVGYDKLGDGNIERILVVPKTEFHNPINYDDYYYDYSARELRKNSYGNGVVFDIFLNAALDLNFAENKSLVDSISGNDLVTFTRASSGTFVGADGLIKTTPVNFVLNSNIVQGSPIGTSILNSTESVVSPRGITETVRRLGRDLQAGGAQVWRVGSTSGGTPNTTYTISFFAKTVSGGTTSINIDINDTPPTGGQATTITGEWTRIVKTGGSRPNNLRFFDMNMVTSTEDFYVWGAQIEIGTTATDYIPTTSTISGAPRFDHNPSTGESLGLLIEEARTNLIDSDYTTSSPIGGTSLSEDASITNPDGTTVAIKVTALANNSRHEIQKTSAPPSTSHTHSVFVKKGNHRYVGLSQGGASNNIHMIFDFDAKTITDTGAVNNGTFESAGVEEYANGWFRLYLVGTTGGSILRTFMAQNDQQDGLANWAATGNEFFYIWGAQKEAGTFPTSFIPSTSSATRAADVVDITGTNFSNFYNQTEGTVFAEYKHANIETFSSNVYVFNADADNRILSLSRFDRQYLGLVETAGVHETEIIKNTGWVNNQYYKTAFGVANNNVAMFLDGAQQGSTDTSVTLPTVNNLSIGRKPDSNNRFINGHIKRLSYFATRQPNETLQSITS